MSGIEGVVDGKIIGGGDTWPLLGRFCAFADFVFSTFMVVWGFLFLGGFIIICIASLLVIA